MLINVSWNPSYASHAPALFNADIQIQGYLHILKIWRARFEEAMPWEELKQLNLSFGHLSVARILKMLANDCPNLQSLSLEVSQTNDDNTYSHDRVVSHEHLEELKLSMLDDMLLTRIALPKLRKLSMLLPVERNDGLVGFLQRSRCPLEYPSYMALTGLWPQILQVVSPSLKELELTGNNSDEAMRCLPVDHNIGPDTRITCPRLHRIKYRYFEFLEGNPPALDVVESRWDPPAHLGVTRLQEAYVRLDDTDRWGNQSVEESDSKHLVQMVEARFERLRKLPRDVRFERVVQLDITFGSVSRQYDLRT